MASIFSTERLARGSAQRPLAVIAVWVLVFLIGGFLASRISEVLTNEQDFTNEPESKHALNLIEQRMGGADKASEIVIVRSPSLTVDDSQYKAFVGQLLDAIRKTGDTVVGATSYYETQNAAFVSRDKHTTMLPVTLDATVQNAPDKVGPLLDTIKPQNGQQGFEVVTGGPGSIGDSFNKVSEEDIKTGEGIGIGVALLILLVVFGTVVAALIPIGLALVAITIATGAAFLAGQIFGLSFFVTNMITMIGLAVGIDYSLFIVQRFREERRSGQEKINAISRAGATASRTVLFSGSTVIVALIGMFLVPSSIFRSLAIGAILVVIFAVLAALTLLPAVLALVGDTVNRLRVPFVHLSSGTNGGFWSRTASAVMAHPVLSLVLGTAVLVAAAVPYATINLGFSGPASFPAGTQPKRAFELLNSEFNAGLLQQEEIVIDAPNTKAQPIQDAIKRLQETMSKDPLFGPSSVQQADAGNLAVVRVPIGGGEASSTPALDALDRLRHTYIPQAFAGTGAGVYVGGAVSGNTDFFAVVRQYTPIVFAVVLGLSFIILLLVFRSLVVPAKAIVMNLLSVGAAYGLLVLVFQHGVGNELFGFQQVERIEAWLPLMLFTILFGLSMDYHVFLLSRIRERYDETRDNKGSVAFGVRSTAGIITGAALIMVAVFGGFAAGRLVMLQQMGFGLGVAVILDATIIRVVLVPAAMELLGDRNWYLPSWLNWLPEVRVEGPRAPAPAGREPVASLD